jgi:hypothetical protein
MNDRSSRAHSLVMLSLVQRADGAEKRSRLFLADLGGSEKLSRSKAADGVRSKVKADPSPPTPFEPTDPTLNPPPGPFCSSSTPFLHLRGGRVGGSKGPSSCSPEV